ncbi:helix-turn-helix domain-containing protein [Corynebacterium flavescens]|uniref:helix-turn-helix domain-containing protein n=1 Tax=Corynebacterium flavescens TaxID=28028 RepID=UPI003FCFDB62
MRQGNINQELAGIGPRLRIARRDRNLTLEELAGAAGISASTLSRLESGKRQANLELLVPLIRQLGIRLDDLFPHEVRDPRVRRSSIRRGGLIITPLAPDSSPVRTFKIDYPRAKRRPAKRVHTGYEWIYVLNGSILLQLGDRDLILGPGEAAEFDTREPHAISATQEGPAQVLSIFNAEGVRMHTHGAGDVE